MQSENLIEYRVIDLGEFHPSSFDKKNILCLNEPVELRGDCDSKIVGQIFFYCLERATEIIYRKNQGESATILFSVLDDSEGIHPFDVTYSPVEFTKKETMLLKKKEKGEEITLALESLWGEAQKKKSKVLKEFLLEIYSISPHKEKVILRGEIPTFPLLLVLARFSLGKGKIYFENTLLRTSV